MPARSKIMMLPDEIKAELDRRLISGNFANYEEEAEWLNEQLREAGLEISISRSAVHRYGQEFEDKCEAIKIATEQAKAIVGVVGDDEGSMNEALIRLIQQLSFDILIKNRDKDDEDMGAILPKMGVMVAKLSKASVDQKKWQRDMKEKAVQAVKNIESKATTGKKSLDPETLRIIREEIYGII